MAKEPKQERIKREKDGLDVWDDLVRYARMDYDDIPDDEFERFKWYGVYRQRPNDGYFMIRIKIPGGQLTSTQLREIGKMTRTYARDIGDITTRQDIQLHWVTLDAIPAVMDRIYKKLGMHQQFSCGDAPRNVTGCPLAGVVKDEIVDTSALIGQVSQMYKDGGKEFSNLPRKFKTTIGGCTLHCHQPQINDIGMYGVRRNGDVGLGLIVGGGLRNTPHFAENLRVFLPPDAALIKDVCRRTANLFRDQEQLRQGRLKARLKFYVAQIGPMAFRDQLEKYLGYELDHWDECPLPDAVHTDHVGVGEQKNGLYYVGVPIERGRLSGKNMMDLADLAQQYGAGEDGVLRNSQKQNTLILDIPEKNVDELCSELDKVGLSPRAHALRQSLISCTGIQFCNLAVVETKQRAKEILEYLETNVEIDDSLFISVTGCPNSCAQYQIADIGLEGVPVKWNGQRIDGFFIMLGARLGANCRFNTKLTGPDGKELKIPSPLVHKSLERILNAFTAERINEDETFADWVDRQDMTTLAALATPPETVGS